LEQKIGPVILHVTTEMEPEWEDDINKWYDEEHVPEIMGSPGFISCRRFVQVTGAPMRRPQTYLCIYEIANPQVVQERGYLTYHTGWKGAPSLRTAWTEQSSQHYRTHRSVRRQIFPVHSSYTDHSGETGMEPVPVVGSGLDDNWHEPIGEAVLHVFMTPDPEWEPEILDWYDRGQIPTLLACPGFLSARRFMLRYDEDRGDPSVLGHHKYLCVYQLADTTAVETDEYRAALASLADSRAQIPGGSFVNETLYRQTFPATGSYDEPPRS